MRIIIIPFIVLATAVTFLQASLCGEGFLTIKKTINNYNITECNCKCTMQDNIFYIQSKRNPSIFHQINGVSILSENVDKLNININPSMNYFLSNKKPCGTNEVNQFQKVDLFIFTLIPGNSGYCYDLSGYFDKDENITSINNLVYKKIGIIKRNKQPLFKAPNRSSKTKMYLIKGDKVEVLEEKDNWLHILYRGKKDIKAWIPKCAVREE
ncbi:MAG: hypothetical protein COB42_03460 [Sulfurimonas sp.]|nr:MAG: hypothetical protein COB42_03460 [Sulfurimonas sp.]